MNEHKLRQLEAQRAEIRQFLSLFQRAAFRPDDGNNGGDPTAAFNAINETRIALAKGSTAFVSFEPAARFFADLETGLLEIEHAVRQKYPAVIDLAVQWRGMPLNTKERLQSIKSALGDEYEHAAMFIRAEAVRVYDSPEKARPLLAELDRQINELIEKEGAAGPSVYYIDQSKHIHQEGGVNIYNEGEIDVDGDVIGGDKQGK
jgi:hypothetical protein